MSGGDGALRRRLGDLAGMDPQETEAWLGDAGSRPDGPVRAPGGGDDEPAGHAAGRRVVEILRSRTDDPGDDGRGREGGAEDPAA